MGFLIKQGMEKPEIVRFKKHKSNSSFADQTGLMPPAGRGAGKGALSL